MMKPLIFLSVTLLLAGSPQPCAAQKMHAHFSNIHAQIPVTAPAGDLNRTAFYKRSGEVRKWQRRRVFGYCNLVSGGGHFAFFTYTALKEKDPRWALLALPFGAVGYLGFHSIRKANKNLGRIRQDRLMLNVAPGSVTLRLKM
ncbi:hypothetical protein LQ567_13810 [Niabella pedocola]|uniref:Uncharacterized protein n=1 Tax=Niabella pedocola TaxID=1752077 RepID=A0ABS8PRZ1_9BACT|nr:hypothetical protein [Niabella pedocola]MCD2423847.1 hypothetical protein [Niabella pedocola]